MVEDEFTPLGPIHIFGALGHPLRLYIFEYLCHEELTAEGLAEVSGSGYKNIYKQLKILEQNGLVESFLDGKYRYYIARKESLDDLKRWQTGISGALTKL